MRNCFFILLVLLVFSCSTKETKHPTPSHEALHQEDGHSHSHSDTAPSSTHVKGDKTAFLVGIWEVENAMIGIKPNKRKLYRGMWIDMKPDMTFTHGQYGNTKGKGTYSFDDSNKRILQFNFTPSINYFPNKVEVLGYSGSLVWMGYIPDLDKNAQIKMIMVNEKPVQK